VRSHAQDHTGPDQIGVNRHYTHWGAAATVRGSISVIACSHQFDGGSIMRGEARSGFATNLGAGSRLPDRKATLAPASVSAGQTATATVTITSLAGFSGAVSLACSVSPGGGEAPTCSLAPATIQSSAGPSATSMLTISTTAQHARIVPNDFSEPGPRVAALWLPLSGFLLAGVLLAKGRGSKQTWLTCLLACALAGLLGTQMACGGSQGSSTGGGGGGTTAGSYVINIQGTSGATQHSASVNLSVR
jgi:hypothetical protein